MKKKFIQFMVCLGVLLGTFSTVGVPFVTAEPPAEPSNPYPAQGSSAVTVFVKLHWGNSGAGVTYDVYFGTNAQPPLVASNQSIPMYDPGFLVFNTTYYWQIIAYNSDQESTPGPLWSFLTADDQPPFNPMIVSGPTAAGKNIQLNFTAIAPDPEGDEVYYQWDWGDGNFSTWLGPYFFGDHVVTSYKWEQNGTYSIKIRAKDNHGKISVWSSSYLLSIDSQIRFTAIKPGYVLISPFGFDLAYGYINYFDTLGLSVIIGTTNSVFGINTTVSSAVYQVNYEMGNLISSTEIWTTSDENVTGNYSAGYFYISPGLYQTTAYAYDTHGNLIDKTQREFVFYYQWKFRVIKGLVSRLTGGKIQVQ
jgi:hypothetical protein